MGMYKHLSDVAKVLRSDETLLRLLYYQPEDISKNVPDPLDPKLKNITEMDIDKQWEIIDEHICLSPIAEDLETKKICRIFIYAGRRKPNNYNYLVAQQSIVVDILVHFSFEQGDIRVSRIADRINELLTLSTVTGYGKVDYIEGVPINSPKNYVGYQHVFKVGSIKVWV